MELVKLLMADCQTTGDIQAKLKDEDQKHIRYDLLDLTITPYCDILFS